jgi:hypothetical protein
MELGVILRLRAKEKDINKYENTLLQAHRNASAWVNANGKQAPIHAYLIENGKCNLEPMLYHSLEQMDEIVAKENSKRIIKKFLVKKA